MKLVTMIVAPGRLDALKKALWDQGFRSLTVSPAEGLGLQKSLLEGGAKEGDFVVAMSPRLRVEIAVKSADAERLVDTALDCLRTGRVGDGKLFVTSLEEVVRVRTGERGDAAL
jgi:nitrogen regulatory protein P-II 1